MKSISKKYCYIFALLRFLLQPPSFSDLPYIYSMSSNLHDMVSKLTHSLSLNASNIFPSRPPSQHPGLASVPTLPDSNIVPAPTPLMAEATLPIQLPETDRDFPLLSNDSTTTKLPTSYNINSLFHVHMTKTDFICWKSHFQGVLQLHELTYILDDLAPPVPTATCEPNPNYSNWKKADQLVLMCIQSTVSTSVQTMILHC